MHIGKPSTTKLCSHLATLINVKHPTGKDKERVWNHPNLHSNCILGQPGVCLTPQTHTFQSHGFSLLRKWPSDCHLLAEWWTSARYFLKLLSCGSKVLEISRVQEYSVVGDEGPMAKVSLFFKLF